MLPNTSRFVGSSSIFMKSRTIEPMSCALCGRLTGLVGLRLWPTTANTGTRSHHAWNRPIDACSKPTVPCISVIIGLPAALRVAVRDRGAGFLVQHRQDLGLAIAAVVDQRLVNAFEGRAGIDGDVVEVECLEHVDHVVGAGMLNESGIDARLGRDEIGARVGLRRSRDCRACARRGGLLGSARSRDDRAGGARGARSCAFEKAATIDGVRRGAIDSFGHGIPH